MRREKFSLEKVSKNPAVFDEQKLLWLNGHYLNALPIEDLQKRVSADIPLETIDLVRTRCHTLNAVIAQAKTLLEDPQEYDPKGLEKHGSPEVSTHLETLVKRLSNETTFDPDTLENTFKTLGEENQIKPAIYIHPCRLALTGVTVGPSLYHLMAHLGKETCLRRLQAFISRQVV